MSKRFALRSRRAGWLAAGMATLAAGGGVAATLIPAGAASGATGAGLIATLDSHYSLLSNTSAASETPLPSKLLGRTGFQSVEQALQLNLSDARMVAGPSGSQAWLVPGVAGYCYVESIPAVEDSTVTACGDALPTNGFLGQNLQDGSEYVTAGFVPDGNPTVSVSAGGASKAAGVSGNFFYATSSQAPQSITFDALSGSKVSQAIHRKAEGKRAAKPRHSRAHRATRQHS